MKNNTKYNKDDEISMKEYQLAQIELEKAQKEAGIIPEEKGLKRMISWIFDKSANRQKHKVKKMLYLGIALVGGWCGAHRFYEKRYYLGLIYALPVLLSIFNKNLFSFVGFSMAMTIIDMLIAIGIYSDENGEIEI